MVCSVLSEMLAGSDSLCYANYKRKVEASLKWGPWPFKNWVSTTVLKQEKNPCHQATTGRDVCEVTFVSSVRNRSCFPWWLPTRSVLTRVTWLSFP